MKKITYISICVGVLIIIIVSFFYCEPSEEYEVSFSHDIQPILNTKCLTCHGDQGTVGLELTSYSTVIKGSDRGSVIIPYDADNSFLYQKVALDNPGTGDRMPEDGPPYLTDNYIKLIGDWIDQGAKDN